MEKADIGLIGLGVMGQNLALNLANKGWKVVVWNRTVPGKEENVVEHFIANRAKGKGIIGSNELTDFVEALKTPRVILLMVQAGPAVDELTGKLFPLMEKGDILIDGGNSYYEDTERRVKELYDKGMYFVGCGISGGEEGALHGASIMPGGAQEAWSVIQPMLKSIAAKAEDGTPCCEWVGPGGAGHYVKMVHNGIEYGDMQLIAESYFMLRKYGQLENDEIADIFAGWNKGELNSYLIGITADICRVRDTDGGYLLDRILDIAGQKGTGKWTAEAALEESDPLTLITEAVHARFLSAMADERSKASALYRSENNDIHEHAGLPDLLRHALYASKLISYAQGFSLLKKASEHYQWNLDYGMLAKIWRKGCIIRSVFLEQITRAYHALPGLENLLFDDFFRNRILEALPAWRKITADCLLSGIPIPCMAAALTYFDGLRTERSSANLIQAQRDYFGAHTYERTDMERGQFFHTDWNETGGNVSGTYNA